MDIELYDNLLSDRRKCIQKLKDIDEKIKPYESKFKQYAKGGNYILNQEDDI